MDRMIKVCIDGNKVVEAKVGSRIVDVIGSSNEIGSPLLAIVDGEIAELTKIIHYDVDVKLINLSAPLGVRTYFRSLIFLLVKATKDIFPEARVVIEHSLNKGVYGEIHHSKETDENDIEIIKNRMAEIVSQDPIIEKFHIKKQEAVRIFESYGMKDKLRLLRHVEHKYINLYKCGNLYDYFYGPMVPSMGYLKLFNLIFYKPGFILMYPHEDDIYTIKPFKDLPKLYKVFKETEEWAKILDVADVGGLNDDVESGDIKEIVLVSEGLHEKKIANIADKIFENKDRVKLVLIAGPSSSGKTTFSKRLSIQLRVLGLKPKTISLDDYFVDRESTPKDEKGNYDFESIYALNLELFNNHLSTLLSGGEVEFPVFNFITGTSEWTKTKYRMEDNSILVIEGIHGLNELLTGSIERDNKYKIYISALTQLNIDDHNRIPTTDVRILRRIVRDNLYRGKNAENTILSFPSVRAGEEKNIFPYQEEADIMFNSTVAYEMCVLKRFAEPLLNEISIDSEAYQEAKRLLIFLSYFKTLEDEEMYDLIPKNSIIREFIGESCFAH